MEKGRQPVSPADLLSFLIGATIVANRHFIDPTTQLRNLDDDFWFKAKAVGLQMYAPENVSTKYFVADLHVRQVEPCRDIRKQRENTITHIVPEVQNPMGSTTEPIAEHNIRLILENRLQ